jgi:putative phosphoribosyl transferase
MTRTFSDRTEAGRELAGELAKLDLREPLVVLALPRGGVPVAAEVARQLGAPLDLLLVRKIGAPSQPELAVAAIVDGERPDVVVDSRLLRQLGVDPSYVDREAAKQLQEIERRRVLYLGGRPPLAVQGCAAIVVDDGIATGTTMRAALQAVRRRGPAALVLAVPVAPHDTIEALRKEVDRVVCLSEPDPFYAVGAHYQDFEQVSDAEVVSILSSLTSGPSSGQRSGRRTVS